MPVIATYLHLDILERHSDGTLACLTGWIAVEDGHSVVAIGLRAPDGNYVRCNYPFHRADTLSAIRLAGGRGMIGFNIVAAESAGLASGPLDFGVIIESLDSGTRAFSVRTDARTGTTRDLRLGQAELIDALPDLKELDPVDTGAALEHQLMGQLAHERHLVLRLDLVNKCNLRCVMCHYSNEDFARRPLQRISPEQFAAFFKPLAPHTRDAVLSCGDEPLISPHFETIIRQIADEDPGVRMRFCTNGMLLSEKLAAAIIDTKVHLVMFSFDGVTSETLHRIRVGSVYWRIIRNICQLRQLRAKSGTGKPYFVFNYVMLESNIHEAALFVEVARRLGGDYIDFRHVVEYPFYDIRHEMLENYKPKYNFYRDKIVEAARAAGMEVYLPAAFETGLKHDASADPKVDLAEFEKIVAQFEHEPSPHIPQGNERVEASRIRPAAHFFCDRPFTEAMIREQKDVYPCPWHKEKMGTLDGTQTLADIFFGENFRKVRLAMLNPTGAPGCEGCPIKANFLPTSFSAGEPLSRRS